MQLGLVGLGKMGFNMRERLRAGGHEVVGYDPRPEVSDVANLADLAGALEAPRVVWVMVPSGTVTHETITALADVLSAGDLVIDVATRATPRMAHTQSCWATRESTSSTPACPAAYGGFTRDTV